MNQKRLESVWLRFAKQEKIADVDGSMFVSQLETQPDLLGEVADERIVDAVLRLAGKSESQHETFIQGCVSRLDTAITQDKGLYDETTSKLATDDARSEWEPEPELDVGFIFEEANSVASSDQSSDDVKIQLSQPRSQSLRESDSAKRNQASRVAAVVAALFLGLSGLTWLSFWMLQNDVRTTEHVERTSHVEESAALAQAHDAPVDGESLDSDLATETPSELASGEDQEQLASDSNPISTEPGLPKISFPELKPKAESDSTESEAVARSEEKVRQPVTFASIVDRGNLRWSSSEPNERIGANGQLVLASGKGVIEFDDGQKIYFQAPLEARLINSSHVEIDNGTLLVEISMRQPPLELSVGSYQLLAEPGAQVQLDSPPDDSLELHLTRGRGKLRRRSERPTDREIALAPGGLNQIIATSGSDKSRPTVLIAKGRRQFLGQVGVGEHIWETGSPTDLQQLTQNLTEQRADFADFDFRQQWEAAIGRLADRGNQPIGPADLREFSKLLFPEKKFQNLGDDDGQGATTFQATISFNGRTITFDTREEFDRMRQQLMNDGQSFKENSFPMGLKEFQQAVNEKFQIDGRDFQFSSPDKLKQLQRALKRQ